MGTNHLSSETTSERIAKLIVDMIINIKKENHSVSMSGIVPQNDTPNNKAWDVTSRSGTIEDWTAWRCAKKRKLIIQGIKI